MAVLISMGVFMVPCASCIASIAWSFPSELAEGNIGVVVGMVSWAGTMANAVIPPYITQIIPNNNAYPIFMFFAFYLGIANFLNLNMVFDYFSSKHVVKM